MLVMFIGEILVNVQRAAETAQKQFNDWLRTGKNPPPEYADVTEAERLAMYQQTPEYQAYQANIAPIRL